MGRRRLLWVLLGACALLFALPGLASAASYSWNQPADFTATGGGANPDHDAYGGAPWSYDEGQTTCTVVVTSCLSPPTFDPSSPKALPKFETISGTVVGWHDPAESYPGYIGVDTAAPNVLQIRAPLDRVEALGWTSPLGHDATVNVNGTVTAGGATACFSWALISGSDQIASHTGAGGIAASSVSVPRGGSLYLTFTSSRSTLDSSNCDLANVTLQIGVSEPTPVTLTSPANGSSTSSSQPAFSGQGTTDYASSSTVTVKVYSGSSASGTPLQTLTATRGGDGSFSVAPTSALSAGTYTAQASQSIPGDPGQSAPSTFQVVGSSSPVTLNLPSTAGPLTTSSPTLTGQSGGDAATVAVDVYAGRTVAGGSPVRVLNASRNVSTGTYAVAVTPPLPDGEYTAIARQQGSEPGVSNTVTFRIKANAPALSVLAPRRGGSAFGPRPTFLGGAGSSLGDANAVTVTLHQGSSSEGASLGSQTAPVVGGRWTLRWSRPLADGFYNLVVQQGDDAGHTSLQYVSFVVVPAPPVIGSRVSLRGSTASVAITCTAAYGTCSGNVLALSTRQLRTRAASPFGYVRVLFAYARIGAGQTAVVRTRLPGYVAAALRRVHRLQVKVTVSMVGVGRVSATRSVTG